MCWSPSCLWSPLLVWLLNWNLSLVSHHSPQSNSQLLPIHLLTPHIQYSRLKRKHETLNLSIWFIFDDQSLICSAYRTSDGTIQMTCGQRNPKNLQFLSLKSLLILIPSAPLEQLIHVWWWPVNDHTSALKIISTVSWSSAGQVVTSRISWCHRDLVYHQLCQIIILHTAQFVCLDLILSLNSSRVNNSAVHRTSVWIWPLK